MNNIYQYSVIEESKEVEITIGEGTITQLKSKILDISPDKIIVITDSNVKTLHGDILKQNLNGLDICVLVIEAGEKHKNLDTYSSLCEQVLNKNITKKTIIIAFGGGVVGNITGFVASTVFRGLRFVHIPTTVMSQADSTIGGKQAVNTLHGKNTIGIFYEPEFIIIDTNFLSTLPKREVKSGIAECIKHALCQDNELLSILLKPNFDSKNIGRIINKVIQLKLSIIKKDRKEKDIGKILVYGHTIGHAIESISKGTLTHGESISIGMCCVAKISNKLGYLNDEGLSKHYEVFNNRELPTTIPNNITIEKIAKQLIYDKKDRDKNIEFVLLEDIGEILSKKGGFSLPIQLDLIKNCLKECY